MILLSKLIDWFLPSLREKHGERLLPSHEKALDAMANCRTGNSPVMLVECSDCGNKEVIPHSCGHRGCPHCQHYESQQWLARQRAKLLPVSYFMVTFTLPRQLRGLVFSNQQLCYDLLMRLAWQTLREFGRNDKQLHSVLGATAVLHTNTRSLDFHPHVHFIVPAGALDPKHRLWRRKRGKYLFREQNLAKVFRAKGSSPPWPSRDLTSVQPYRKIGSSIASTWDAGRRRSRILVSTSTAGSCARRTSSPARTDR